MASKSEVGDALERLMARLDGNETNVRSAIPGHKVLRCRVPDVGSTWYAVIDNGHVSRPAEQPPDDGHVDVTLQVNSDDLIDLVGRGGVDTPGGFSARVQLQARPDARDHARARGRGFR